MSPKFTSPRDKDFFHTQVWEKVRQIPPGKVATYGQIAGMIPIPEGVTQEGYHAFGARWVGGAMAACPEDVPWFRVVNAQGKISLRRGDGGKTQRQRLEAEGVVFDKRQRIDLAQYRWSGSQEETPL